MMVALSMCGAMGEGVLGRVCVVLAPMTLS